MSIKNRLVYKLFVGLVLGSILLVVAIRVAKQTIYLRIEERLKEINIHASQIDFDLLTRTLKIDDISSIDSVESGTRNSLNIRGISLIGIRILPLIIRKVFRARSLNIDTGSVEINYNDIYTRSNRNTSNLVGIYIDSINISNIRLSIVTDTALQYRSTVDLTLTGLQVPNLTDTTLTVWRTSNVDVLDVQLKDIFFHEAGSQYTTEVKMISANSAKQSLSIDSILLSPIYDKYEFALKKGKQTDRISLSVPEIRVTGIDFMHLRDSVIHIMDISIRDTDLQLYRDKRVAFVPGKDIPLPQELISKFPFTIAIDSIHVHDASIFYEIFPEKGFHPGNVSFENLSATMDHVSNHRYYKNIPQATLVAQANLQGKGLIAASFTIPYSKKRLYNATGVISHLPLPLLNPMLENMAFIRIVSGKLNSLKFEFDYNSFSSTGSILINYEDLKVQSLTKEKEADPNELKSFMLNIMLRNNKGKDVSKEKRTGVINIEPNRKKAIFNLWFKSILAGIENSVIDLSVDNDD